MNGIHEGGCLCGEVRYRTVGEPVLATVCHCTFCQKRTGSAFALPVMFQAEYVEFSGGQRTTYQHHSDESQRWLRLEFCPRCGTTVAWTVQRRPGMIGIAGGIFDQPEWVTGRTHIWVRSAQKATVIPANAQRFEMGMPA